MLSPLEPGRRLPEESDWRTRWEGWRDQYDNVRGDGPNYLRKMCREVAGLFQAEPIRYATGTDENVQPMSEDELSNLTQETAMVAAGQGVAFLRPVRVAGEWSLGSLSPAQVEFEFMHKRLVEAVVWSEHDVDDDLYVITETYELVDGERTVTVQAWEASRGSGERLTLEDEIDLEQVRAAGDDEMVPAVLRSAAEMDDRALFAYVWEWDENVPAPVHVTNETYLDDIADLHDVEQTDANVVHNVFQMSSGMVIDRTRYQTSRNQLVIPRGFGRNNLLITEQDAMRQDGIESELQHLHIPDNLTQNERIYSKVNDLYEACGFNPSTFGRNVTGRSDSAEAKRVDNQSTLVTITAPANRYRGVINAAVDEVARLQTGAEATEVTVELTAGLRTDQAERIENATTAVAGGVYSTDTGVKIAQPQLSDEERANEVAAIQAEQQLGMPDEPGSFV